MIGAVRTRPNLLAWQWGIYEGSHQDRRNLLVHALTAPLFLAGTIAFVSSPFVSLWFLPAGLLAMVSAMALQGRTHRLEKVAPAPFLGPLDVLARIVAEQWITFPRFVLSGTFGRAWRSGASAKAQGTPKSA
jgi:hypothetical protein